MLFQGSLFEILPIQFKIETWLINLSITQVCFFNCASNSPNYSTQIKQMNQFIRQMYEEQKTLNFEVYDSQVSGKQPKLLSDDQTKLLKGFSQIQRDFYIQILSYHLSHPFSSIHRHIAKFYGVMQLNSDPSIQLAHSNHQKNTLAWLTHLTERYKIRNYGNKFIILQNLTYGMQSPNIFDVKIGGRNVEGKKHKITKSVSQYFIRLNGCKMHFPAWQNKTTFLSKYYMMEAATLDKIFEYFRLFFFDGYRIHLGTIGSIIERLKELILAFKSLRGYKFISSSICIIYDAKNPQKFDIKLLDFGRVHHCQPDFIDDDSLSGLVNIHRFLSMILDMGQANVQELMERRKFYCESDITIVPDRKKIKYNITQQQSLSKV